MQWTNLAYGVWSLDQHWLVLVLVFGPATRVPEPLVQNFEKNSNWNQNWPKIKTGTKPATRLQLEPNPERKATVKPSLSRFQF
jgi:hypothetical protein